MLLGHAGKSSLPLTIARPAYSFGPDFKWELSLEAAAGHYVEQNDRDGNFAGTEDGNFEDRVINPWLERIKHFRM